MSAERPIFIGGLSFTGKTQLRAMLSAHPNILIARRTHLWDRFYKRYGIRESDGSQPTEPARELTPAH